MCLVRVSKGLKLELQAFNLKIQKKTGNGEGSLFGYPGRANLIGFEIHGLTGILVAVFELFPGHPKIFTWEGLNFYFERKHLNPKAYLKWSG